MGLLQNNIFQWRLMNFKLYFIHQKNIFVKHISLKTYEWINDIDNFIVSGQIMHKKPLVRFNTFLYQ